MRLITYLIGILLFLILHGAELPRLFLQWFRKIDARIEIFWESEKYNNTPRFQTIKLCCLVFVLIFLMQVLWMV
jgi:hypothetical protein